MQIPPWLSVPAGAGDSIDALVDQLVNDGVIDLLGLIPPPLGFAQRALETRALSRVYEHGSRRLITKAFTGLGYAGEERFVRASLRGLPPGGLLDVACGTGRYARLGARCLPDREVVGSDVSLPMLVQAAALAPALTWVRADAMDLPVRDHTLAAVTMLAALHLLPDPARALCEAARVLVPGGVWVGLVARRWSVPVAGRLLHVAGASIGVHFFRDAELDQLFRQAGLTIEEVERHGMIALIRARAPGGPDRGGHGRASHGRGTRG